MGIRRDSTSTELASNFDERDYERASNGHPPDRAAIADAICRRFTERYITPVRSKERHGFTMMAVSCLMIEALESFRQGWDTTHGPKSKAAFCHFFDSSEPFRQLRGHAQAFYYNVRCGLLHQAETTGGWRIRRDGGALFNAIDLTINAEKFLQGLERVLLDFRNELRAAEWNGPAWKKVHIKMRAIIRHCQKEPNVGKT